MCKLVTYNDLDVIQKANAELSLAWKKQSYDLIVSVLNKENDEKVGDDLIKAILWCERKGHATRYISKGEKESIGKKISEWLKDNWKSKLVFKSIPEEIDSKGYSWVSKICHIMNPIDNPLVYDSKTRKHIKAYDYERWLKKSEAFVSRYKAEKGGLNTPDAIYKFDSVIWAFYSEEDDR